jgi:hypothetical protein
MFEMPLGHGMNGKCIELINIGGKEFTVESDKPTLLKLQHPSNW